MASVFLSYATADREIARRLSADLRRQGIDTWSDMDLDVGTNWVTEITRRLNEATAVLVLITPYSLQSENVFREWSSALLESQRVLPVLAGGVTFNQLPPPLSAIQGVDLDADYPAAVNRIIASFNSLTGSREPPAAESFNADQVVDDLVAKVLERLKVEKPGQQDDDGIDEQLLFVITSFEPDMEPAFEAIKAAGSAVGLRAQRAKDVPGDYRISDKMLKMIRQARLVVADLTHERPNVYFELGYARGIGKTVVTIMRAGTNVHFDVQDWTYLKYIDSRPLERDLVERFKAELS